ncbi:MAG: class I adenylate-forming enzyme family protein [Halobellus sp.]|uniref:class I adenylate-forming enzyme family protein n=1 Tax=Halobellus sp. TaxID=1979212 RepID=UPI0035D3EF6B
MRDLRAFRRVVDRFGERTALVTTAGTERTYAELGRRTDALANALDSRVSDARTASLLRNGTAAIEMMLAAQKRGRANAQLSFRGAVGELRRMVETAEAETLVYDEANAEMAEAVLDELEFDVALYTGDDVPERPNVESYEQAIQSAGRDYDAVEDPDGETGVLYTSGSTSEPKAILEDQRRVWMGGTQAVMEMSLDPTDVALVTTPWYHDVTTVAWIYPHLQVGATLVLQPEFIPPESLTLMDEHDVTGLLAVPAQLEALLDLYDEESYDLSALSYVRTGGAVVPPSLVERVRDRMTEGVHNTYGLTEGIANLTHAYPDEQLESPGTVGNATFTWDLRVVEAAPPNEDPDPMATVGRGKTGELIGKGPSASGYLDSPEAEARLFIEGGWLRTMDVAYIDDHGRLHIVDRVDNMLVSGGENIYPQEVELALEDHTDVREAAVVGVPDDKWGERVSAVVVGDVSADALDEHCRDHDELADFKRPRSYVVTDEPLPRSDTGTLLRDDIRSAHFDDKIQT